MKASTWFSSLGIKRKVQYIFMLAIGICLLCCFVFFYFMFRSRMTDTVLEKSRDNMLSISRNFESVVSSVNNISKIVMVNDSVTTYLKSEESNHLYSSEASLEIYNILNSFSGSYSVFIFKNDKSFLYTGIGIINPDIEIIYSPKWHGLVSELEGGYTLIPNNDGAFNYKTKADVISFARIINDIDTQKPIGMLVINIPISEFEQTYFGLSDDDNHFAYIDKNKNIICADADFDFSDEVFTVGDGEIIQIPENESLTERIVSSAVPLHSGIFAVSSSRVQIMGDASTELFASVTGVLLIAIIIITLINIYINRYITFPISKLADSMKNTNEELPQIVSIRCGNDEIGKLQDSYNDMLMQIRRLIDKLISEEKNRQKAEMDALREQINPHFLYNTLETIGYMSLQFPPDDVYNAIETLGSFYRKFLSKGSQTITLKEEMLIVRDYIKLQQLRYEDMFFDRYYIEHELENIIVPRLILQPLVENSIYHGIRPKGEKGLIAVSASRLGNNLRLIVYDSGVGMSEDEIMRLMSADNTKSFGFKGTMDRIRYFCGRDDIVKISSVEGEYCKIEIIIPLDGKVDLGGEF